MDRARGNRCRALADLLRDETGRHSILGVPVKALLEFPGFPLQEADLTALLAACAE